VTVEDDSLADADQWLDKNTITSRFKPES